MADQIPLRLSDSGGIKRFGSDDRVPVTAGGTGVQSLIDLKTALAIDKVDNKTQAEILSGLTQTMVTQLGFTPTSGGVDVSSASTWANNPPLIQFLPNATDPAGSQIGGVNTFGFTNPVYYPAGTTDTLIDSIPSMRWVTHSAGSYEYMGLASNSKVLKFGSTSYGGYVFETSVIFQGFTGNNLLNTVCQIGMTSAGFTYGGFDATSSGIGAWVGWSLGNSVIPALYISDGGVLTTIPLTGLTITATTSLYIRIVAVPGDGLHVTVKDLITGNVGLNNYKVTVSATFAQTPMFVNQGICTLATGITGTMAVQFTSAIPFYLYGVRSKTTAAAGGGSSLSLVKVPVDFGSVPITSTNVTVIDVTATTGQSFLASAAPDSDEYEMDPLIVSAYCPIDGEVRIFVNAVDGPVTGIKYITYQKG